MPSKITVAFRVPRFQEPGDAVEHLLPRPRILVGNRLWHDSMRLLPSMRYIARALPLFTISRISFHAGRET